MNTPVPALLFSIYVDSLTAAVQTTQAIESRMIFKPSVLFWGLLQAQGDSIIPKTYQGETR